MQNTRNKEFQQAGRDFTITNKSKEISVVLLATMVVLQIWMLSVICNQHDCIDGLNERLIEHDHQAKDIAKELEPGGHYEYVLREICRMELRNIN